MRLKMSPGSCSGCRSAGRHTRCRASSGCRRRTSAKPLVLLFAGWALRIHSQKNAGLDGVRAPPPWSTVSLMLGMYLLAYRPAVGPPASKPPGLKTSAASPPPHPPKDGNLRHAILEQPLVVVADLGAVHLGRILEHVRETDEGVPEHEFVGHARVEDVGQRGRNRVGPVLALHRRRIGNLPAVAPPQAHREQLRFALQVVAHEQLGVVADAVIHARHPLRVVLVEGLRLHVVEAAGGVGVGVGLRDTGSSEPACSCRSCWPE